ncbi:DUF4340 domain-containing protein [Planctomycetes bacterium K23_9]|uniref:DUF4340 domain-containing protein n=1 Tax=Stieleria marina TaxID=1930275 RepID=A0A517NSG8_9BACT|nr:hypothetical protein K239x_20250 [Planctomycetes bacterium K23_9]
MNELKKTGIFWAVTAVMLLIATVIAWPTSDNADPNSLSELVGEPLIPKFKDPLTVASMKIVSFDEAEGTLSNFEVAKDTESGDWTIVSRKGYPADAVEQVTNAANSLISLKVLDVVPCTREDHDDLGVVEPKLEELNVGDEGVGRLVTFRDTDKKVVASLIIGDSVKDAPEQINVRIPGQDPVYIVALDDKPLTTRFQDWIEEDLLKLSSIDVDAMQVKDYSASLGQGGQISLQRNYSAEFEKDGAQWTLAKLQEYDPKRPTAPPKDVEVKADQKLDTAKLNEIQNALDDLKIVNVLRKPDGMSANLRASEDFLSDQKAVASLAGRGFYPVQLTQESGTEILSANGELSVGLKDGVEYVLRFGNIAGLSQEDPDAEAEVGEEGKKSVTGVNRYLLVTTRVNEEKFPVPVLKEVPQDFKDLQKLDDAEAAKNQLPVELEPVEPESVKAEPAKTEPVAEEKPADAAKSDDVAADKADASEEMKDAKQPESTEGDKAGDKPADAKETKSAVDGEPKSDDASKGDDAEPAVDAKADEKTGESEAEGSESATATGQAFQEADEDDKSDEKAEEPAAEDKKEIKEEAKPAADEKAAEKPAAGEPAAEKPADEEPAEELEETEEEKQERLEATQEKITKENQRKMDERKDSLSKAQKRVRELNARFADWYYVIPEETYTKLTIKRSELFEKEGAASAPNPGAGGPSFQAPGGLPFGPGN